MLLLPVEQEVHFKNLLFCRAPVDDVLAWGESLDHLLECKSEPTHGFTLLALFQLSSLSSFHPHNSLLLSHLYHLE